MKLKTIDVSQPMVSNSDGLHPVNAKTGGPGFYACAANQGRLPVARLSIIIPAVGETELLEAGLVSVLQHRPAGSEILVVLPKPYDDPYNIQDEVQFVSARNGASFAECIATGLSVATGDVVHTLAAGMEVTDGWSGAPLARFADPRVASVAPLLVLEPGGAPLCSAGVTYGLQGARRQIRIGANEAAARVPTLGPELRAGFYRRETLLELAALNTGVGDDLADVDLALTLRAAGYRAVFEPAAKILTPSVAVGRSGGFKAGLGAERLFWRNAPLAGWGKSLLSHPAAWLADIVQVGLRPTLLTHLLGRTVALLEQASFRKRHAQLAQLAETHAASEAALANDGVSLHRLRMDLAHRQNSERENVVRSKAA